MQVFTQPQAAFYAGRAVPKQRYMPADGEAPEDVNEDDSAPNFPELEKGRVRVGRDIISEECLNSVEELASKIKLDESLTPKRLENLINDIRTTETADRNELKEFDKFVRGVNNWHRELHHVYRDSDYKDTRTNNNLIKVHQFLQQWEGARERFRVQARTEELGRIAEGSPAFSPTTAGFYTFAAISQKDMKETLGLMERIREPDGPRRHVQLAAEVKLRDSVGRPQ